MLKVQFDAPPDGKTYFNHQSTQHFFKFFLPSEYQYVQVPEGEPDIFICNVQTTKKLNPKHVNILISVENLDKWSWYKHKNLHGDYNDPDIDIYIYNHKSSIEKTNKYLMVPTIHSYINNYLTNLQLVLEPSYFPDKLFLLVINRSSLNKEIPSYIEVIDKAFPRERIDHISMWSEEIKNKSCYNSPELLRVFNRYRFILCVENSYSDGYITEKIFNCYFSNAIPLYKGAPNVQRFLNPESFIDLRDSRWLDRMMMLNNNEGVYDKVLRSPKISNNYSDESYKTLLYDAITSKISKKKLLTFSLWGDHEFYNYGMLDNAILAKIIFPDWVCVVYHTSNIDPVIRSKLETMDNVKMVLMNKPDDFSNMFWRFAPAFESDVTMLACDADSRLNNKLKLAVDEWLASDKKVLIMRDHPMHRTRILGGMWGARDGVLRFLRDDFLSYQRINKMGCDQEFLQSKVYSHVRDKSMIFDSHSLYFDEVNKARSYLDSNYKGFIGSYCRRASYAFGSLGMADRLLELPERLKGVDKWCCNFY